ncbi:MAG: flagellar biosynthesis anti-sigma factor FlgM [Gemmataceae bacterium]
MTTDPISGMTNPIITDATSPGTSMAGGAKPATTPAGTAATASTDTGEVSHAQTLLSAINTVAQNVPSMDQQRVDQIRAALAQGTLPVNAQNIAQRLIEIEGQLGGSSGRSS